MYWAVEARRPGEESELITEISLVTVANRHVRKTINNKAFAELCASLLTDDSDGPAIYIEAHAVRVKLLEIPE